MVLTVVVLIHVVLMNVQCIDEKTNNPKGEKTEECNKNVNNETSRLCSKD